MGYYEDSRERPKQEDRPRSIFDPAFLPRSQAGSSEACDSALEFVRGLYLACAVKGAHRVHRAREPGGREHTWTD